LLGPPPQGLLNLGKSSHKFFTDTGNPIWLPWTTSLSSVITDTHRSAGDFRSDIPVPERVSLEERETSLEGEGKEKFFALMRKMLQWEPSKRASAKELADDEWIMGYM
jgi:serine/threonine protein kinase